MPGNPLVRFDEGRVGRTAKCRPLSYSTERLCQEDAKAFCCTRDEGGPFGAAL
jgi:hypothetical protein